MRTSSHNFGIQIYGSEPRIAITGEWTGGEKQKSQGMKALIPWRMFFSILFEIIVCMLWWFDECMQYLRLCLIKHCVAAPIISPPLGQAIHKPLGMHLDLWPTVPVFRSDDGMAPYIIA
jgi:hypothetical protein